MDECIYRTIDSGLVLHYVLNDNWMNVIACRFVIDVTVTICYNLITRVQGIHCSIDIGFAI